MHGNSFKNETDLDNLRQKIRAKRRAISKSQRYNSEKKLLIQIEEIALVRKARRLAIYLTIDGEPNLENAIREARQRGTLIFAPIICQNTLRFAQLNEDSKLRTNKLGIQEPLDQIFIDPQKLDVVLTPMVAFDSCGTRIGMGAGYYDRCFDFLAPKKLLRKPKIIGVGYEFQKVQKLERKAWDIPLWGAVTELGFYRFKT